MEGAFGRGGRLRERAQEVRKRPTKRIMELQLTILGLRRLCWAGCRSLVEENALPRSPGLPRSVR